MKILVCISSVPDTTAKINFTADGKEFSSSTFFIKDVQGNLLGLFCINFDTTKHKLIAHAAGGIDRFPYTNSKEAYLNSYKNGFRLFEIDISITSDEKLVARHDWKKSTGKIINLMREGSG